MEVNIRAIQERASELKLSSAEIAEMLGMDQSTYYRKIAKGGCAFTVEQAAKLVDILKLTETEAITIFFGRELA